MLIVCAGRSRSGSTLMYNLVRLTLEESFGIDNVYAITHKHYDKNNNKKCNVVKIHGHNNYLFKNATHVFSCERNLEDQKLSILKFRKIIKNQELSEDELEKFIEYDLSRYERWKNHINFLTTFKFEDLVNNKKIIISEIISLLDLKFDYDADNIINKLNVLKLPKKGYDKKTGLTWHHFTSININKE